MKSISIARASEELEQLMAEVAASNEPILITGLRNDAVLVSADQWRGLQETLYLVSIPGMREKVVEGMATPIQECSGEPVW